MYHSYSKYHHQDNLDMIHYKTPHKMNHLNRKYMNYFYNRLDNMDIFLNILLNNFLLYKNHQYIYLFYHDKFHQYHKFHFQGNYHMIYYKTLHKMNDLNMKYIYYFYHIFHNIDIFLNILLNNFLLYKSIRIINTIIYFIITNSINITSTISRAIIT